jgi:hypothetical protein
MADKRISQLVERINIANNDVLPIVASGATTTNKVTISTIQDWMQDNLDVGVTSVGLSMPSAFTVTNSPVTTSGNISVVGAGTVAQYIRGDGSLADFPQGGGGGGASVSYYLNGSVSQGTIGGIAYREMNKVPVFGAGTDFTISSNGYVASFITDAGDPSLLEIPAGNWNFETYLSASSGGGSPTFYIELYKVNSGGTATLIASNSGTPESISLGTNINPYFSELAVPTTSLTITDRLALRYYVTPAGRTITLHTENSHLCQIITTFTTGLTALNGLTAQVQNFAVGTTGTDFNIASSTATHTFNIPSASATARGLVTTGTQTFAGDKTFSGFVTTNSDAVINGVNIGRGGGAISTNTRVGTSALNANTTGSANSSFGINAGVSNTTGSGNSFFGVSAGAFNITTSNNSFFGRSSGLNNTDSNNTFVGFESGSTKTTGANNSFFGTLSGRFLADGATNLTISNNSIFIGYDTRSAADNQTNQIVIGHTAIGLGSNTTVIGNSSTTFGRWFGNLLVGSSSNSGQMLQVTGTSLLNGLSTIQGTTASDSGQLGAELLTTGTGDASWTGTSFATGYTHVAGSTTTLTSTVAGVVGTFYQITYTVTGRTTGTFNIDFGGQTLSSLTLSFAQGIRATTTGTLVITPTSSFDGTIVLSIRVISASSASVTFNNSAGTVTNQIRISSINTNTIIGLNSGRTNTTGSANSFFGSNVGVNNTTGESNTAIGRQSLFTNTTGGFNTSVGVNSLFGNTTGTTNTAVGASAGQGNTTGSTNSFFGQVSGSANTTGSSNSFFGVSSGQGNTTGGSNSFFGVSAGLANTTEGNNSFFGTSAGSNKIAGANNSFFGSNAGRFTGTGTTAMTSVSNSLYLGYQTRGLNATGSTNEIVIGYDVVGLGSNTTVLGNTSTTHGRWYGNLLIGTDTNSTFALDVNGTGRFSGSLTTGGDLTLSAANPFVYGGTAAGSVGLSNIGGQTYIRVFGASHATTPNITQFVNAGSTSLTILGGGNVGIGTNNPAQRLSVQGEIAKYCGVGGVDGNFENLIKYGSGGDLQSGTSQANRWVGIDATVTAGSAVVNTLRIRAYSGTTGNAAPVNVADFRGDQSSVFYGNVLIGTTNDNGSTLRVNGSLALPHTTKTANYTLDNTDYTVGFDCASNRTATLPDATTCAGRIYVIYHYNTNVGIRYVTLDGNGSQTIDGLTTYSLMGYQDFSSVMIQSNGSNWIIISDKLYPPIT